MPIMNGFEFLHGRLKLGEPTIGIPVIRYSLSSRKTDLAQGEYIDAHKGSIQVA
jgi:CheY-like chemotaxis protein